MKKIKKIITRDLSLIDIEAWYKGYSSGMEYWLDWSYHDTIFYFHSGQVDILRSTKAADNLQEVVFKKIDSNEKWLSNVSQRFDDLLGEIDNFYKTSLSKLKEGGIDNKEIVSIYKKYIDYIEKAMPPFVVMYWIPRWVEEGGDIEGDYENEKKIALKYREKTEDLFPQGAELTDLILEKIQKEINISEDLARVISPDELKEYLLNKGEIRKKKLKKRWEGVIYCKKGLMIPGDFDGGVQEALKSAGYDLVKSSLERDKSSIEGNVASEGHAKGQARVIMRKKNVSKLEEGEILVTSMTTPEYVPAMKKASAIITDEGGVTCHAAIVSRELDKPCIIGTDVATEVLEDGDLVEVDAEEGVVKLIDEN